MSIWTFIWQVLIFAEKKADVDAIHEYLLLKGVEAVAIHGGKGWSESECVPIYASQNLNVCLLFSCPHSDLQRRQEGLAMEQTH